MRVSSKNSYNPKKVTDFLIIYLNSKRQNQCLRLKHICISRSAINFNNLSKTYLINCNLTNNFLTVDFVVSMKTIINRRILLVNQHRYTIFKKLFCHFLFVLFKKYIFFIDGSRRRQGSRFIDRYQIFVGNLPHEATEAELSKIFSEFGQILDLTVYINKPLSEKARPRVPPNYGFVTFKNAAAVQKCLALKVN